MKKILYALFLIGCITACALPFLQADKEVSFATIKKSGSSLVNTTDFKEQDETYIRKQYELNKSDYDAIMCYGVPSAMEVNEFSIVKVKDATKRALVMKKLQGRIDRQYQSFSGYAPRQADLLKKAVLYERGEYVIMIVHKQANSMRDTINALF